MLRSMAASGFSSLLETQIKALTAPEMARGQYWIHPALPEAVENALLGLA